MWKISIQLDDIAGLKSVPAEIDVYREMDDDEQGIRQTFGDDLINNRDNIQVWAIEMSLTKTKAQVQEQLDGVENKIQERLEGIENKIQNLANIVENKSLDRKVDKELWTIEIGDKLWVTHPYKYNNDNSKEPRKVDIGCTITNISGTGYLTVILLKERKEQKIISSLLSLEKWLLDCDGIPIMYRNKTDRQLREYIFVKRGGVTKNIKDLYGEYNATPRNN
ncbi:hypothetical protein C2G38_2146544 [Gigaspora rosea]|uniref:Uncharacterized protein n=1 Tax=Gigaspora rosea TaxID=44941 RepID=A0A397UJN9_9GLOM|nr:hypothetical protein C2G38_2146544 [Gigaspora rosea]